MFCDSCIKRREDKDEKGEETIAFFSENEPRLKSMQ